MDRNTPFVIALNKIDRLFNWKAKNDTSSYKSLKKQEPGVQNEFLEKYNNMMCEFVEMGINVKLYYENKNPEEYYSVIPTSAITGEGMSDLLGYIAYYC